MRGFQASVNPSYGCIAGGAPVSSAWSAIVPSSLGESLDSALIRLMAYIRHVYQGY